VYSYSCGCLYVYLLVVCPWYTLTHSLTHSSRGCCGGRLLCWMRASWCRDVKPDNIFLDHDYNVLLGDFGLSEPFLPGSRTLTPITGTLHYTAPETFLGTPVCGPELDVWSAGVVLYVMLRGRFPFWAATPRDTSRAIMFSEPHWPEWFPRDAIDLLKRMLVKNPSRRASINEIKEHSFIQSEIMFWEQEVALASEWAEAA